MSSDLKLDSPHPQPYDHFITLAQYFVSMFLLEIVDFLKSLF